MSKRVTKITKQDIIDILQSPEMQQSKNYVQHGSVSVYSHSVAVAEHSYKMAKSLEKLGIMFNLKSLVRGALLHDFFQYDWHDDWDLLHGWKHPRLALKNAHKQFNLTMRERDIIRKHMWPMTLLNFPTCREAWLVCFADKYCSLLETFKIYKYDYHEKEGVLS
ncbi:MAG: HD domain-containing protein [Oscillospiraceae bacterium]|nr:HD domain-containing protein [Oscillospiraceae bacterium]